ncbi:hypothetical protein JYJ95_06950 [Corallococcus exiguus]|uniref:hypothetical protein n=1 Tax=Corallococcus exiguus TaxID=83462 RepID=UPI001A8D8C2E|nr:hypothetical protein [Corallococcus exiguus]MBN8466243.1 hypothetical protein [Corallococcus exiguus]
MFHSVKKAAQLLLVVASGAVMSFGTTLAISAPPPEEPLSFCAVNCVNQCIDEGFSYGRCSGDVCVCFYAY